MSILTTRWADASVVVCISGKTPQNAKHAIDEIVNRRDRDVCQKITDVNLIDSRGRHNPALTPVADIQTVLRVVMLHFAICRAFVCCRPANQRRRQRKQSIRPSSPRRRRGLHNRQDATECQTCYRRGGVEPRRRCVSRNNTHMLSI